jgi:hypothetical protein
MLILASSHILKLPSEIEDESITASRHNLQQRWDYDERLSEAFEELITIAQTEEVEVGSIDTIMESGLFVSARSSFHSELAEAVAELNSPSLIFPDGSVDKADLEEDLLEPGEKEFPPKSGI